MLLRDKNILEGLTKKYGKDYILNEISNELIRKTINKYDKVGNRKYQLDRMKEMNRNIIEVEDGRLTWIVDCEYNGVYVFDEATYLRYKDVSKLGREFDVKHAIWTFNFDIGAWRNSVGEDLFPLTTNEEFAKVLADAVKKGYKFNNKNRNRKELDEGLALVRNIDYSDPNTYLADRYKELDFLQKDGYSGYVRYYAYYNDYMLVWHIANKMTVSDTPYAFDIVNGVWLKDKPEFIDEEKTKARELAKFINEVAPRAEKRFKDWHTYLA